MKKKIALVVTALALACCLLLGAVGCGNEGVKKEKTIAVIAKGESHAFWQSVKRGAEAAGKEKGYTITFRGPQSESPESIPSQKEMITAALAGNPSAMVLATIGEGYVDLLEQAYDKHIPVVQFDSGIWAADVKSLNDKNKNPIVASVATSNRKAAALGAEDFFNQIKADIAAKTTGDKYKVGIIQHDQTQTGIDRAGGFKERFEELVAADETTKGKAEVVIEAKDGDGNNAYKTALEALEQKHVDAIFMSNEGVVKQVYDAIQAAGNKYDAIKFYGFDAGTKQQEWMKKTTGPKLYGAVAQDSYQIGYQAVAKAIQYVETQEVPIGGAVWNKDNMDQMKDDGIIYDG